MGSQRPREDSHMKMAGMPVVSPSFLRSRTGRSHASSPPQTFAVKPFACGSWFHLRFEHFDVTSVVDKSRDHGKLLSICSFNYYDYQNDQSNTQEARTRKRKKTIFWLTRWRLFQSKSSLRRSVLFLWIMRCLLERLQKLNMYWNTNN